MEEGSGSPPLAFRAKNVRLLLWDFGIKVGEGHWSWRKFVEIVFNDIEEVAKRRERERESLVVLV